MTRKAPMERKPKSSRKSSFQASLPQDSLWLIGPWMLRRRRSSLILRGHSLMDRKAEVQAW